MLHLHRHVLYKSTFEHTQVRCSTSVRHVVCIYTGSGFKRHMRTHTGVKLYKCETRGDAFTGSNDLHGHEHTQVRRPTHVRHVETHLHREWIYKNI